jgi:Rieske 2Fe-2S family protein
MSTPGLDSSLPKSAYLEEDTLARERELLFARSWWCAAREEDLPATPGAYVTLDVAGEQMLAVRGADGAIRSFANVCRHRGAELVDSTDPSVVAGSFAGGIRCPYHAWTYDLDGALRVTPHLTGIERSALGLHAAEVATWAGFVFVRLAPTGSSFSEELGPTAGRLANYPLAELVTAHRASYDVAANWKVLAENYNECYHCGPVHPELCRLVPAFRRRGGAELDWERGVPHRDGAYTFTTTGTTSRLPFPGLDADEQERHKGELVYPNLLLSLSCDHVVTLVLEPVSAGRTIVDCRFLFHPDEVARPDFDPTDAIDLWDVVNRQDWSICERVQRGMASRWFERGWFAPMEDPSLDIRRWWTSRMGSAADPADDGP